MRTRGFLLAGLLTARVLAAESPHPYFRDATEEIGLDFRHEPMDGDAKLFLMPEIMGSGGAFLDYDGDGDLDIYLIQAAGVNRVYRHEENRFTDVTETSGLGDDGYGMGAAVGDIDNDGLVDVYVTNYGPDGLYRNAGGGRFENVSRKAGIEGDFWSSSATFCDYDGDGFLDLYVAHYVAYDAERPCFKHDGSRDYCGPQEFPGTPDTLYRNQGDGTFADVTGSSGIGDASGPGLGVVCLDLTGDGRLDFYVANDGKANQLWVNQGDGSFLDDAFLIGLALNAFGKEEAGMGIAPGDVDGDGDFDLFVTHLTNETNTLYRNDGDRGFEDGTHQSGLGTIGIATTGFGAVIFDADHDGRLDIAVVNGRVASHPPLEETTVEPFWRPYAEPNFLLRQTDGGRFERLPLDDAVEVSRGLASGDIDEDGDVDLLVTSTAGPARLLVNDAPKRGRWLIARAFDTVRNRDAHGAVVTISVGGARFVRVAAPGQSYMSSGDPRAHFGLPETGDVESLTVLWPGGDLEHFEPVKLDQAVVLEKGKGVAP